MLFSHDIIILDLIYLFYKSLDHQFFIREVSSVEKMNERQVLDKLGIKDFRHLSKVNVMQFASMINEMDPEVAKKAIDQLPNFAEVCKEGLKLYEKNINEVLTSNSSNGKRVFDSYKTIMNVLTSCVEKENISFEEKKYYLEQMKDIAEKVNQHAKDHQNFFIKICTIIASVFVGIIAIFATLFGVKSSIKSNNKN